MTSRNCSEPPSPEPHVPERFIHRLWEELGFPREELRTTDGAPIQIRYPGDLQHDAGPDFADAQLVIDGLIWHGAVEIHRYSSDWYKHGHQSDQRFNSVVLHVTLYRDTQTGHLEREDGTRLPEIVLAPLLNTSIWKFIRSDKQSDDLLPCTHLWKQIPDDRQEKWLQSLGETRLRQRTAALSSDTSQADVEAWLYRKIFRALGYSKNADQMEELADRIPLSVARNLTSTINLEALYLGSAGLLPPPEDEKDTQSVHYLYNARNSFRGMLIEHDLRAMQPPAWTFFRLRPANFPTLRIAQAAAFLLPGKLLHSNPLEKLRSDLRSQYPIKAIRERLSVTPSQFWNTHLRFGDRVDERDASIGRARTDTIVENVIVPLLLFDANQSRDGHQREAAIRIMRSLSTTSDRITRKFEHAEVTISDGLIAQGVHHLYRERCKKTRCFDCRVGKSVLRTSTDADRTVSSSES